MNKARHVLGISGGKDSAALAIYMKTKYPGLDIDYYTCDTGKELDETYQLIENLEVFLGKEIRKLRAVEESHEDPFDHYLKRYGGFLPSTNSRWCTKKLKLEPFEQYVGVDPVVSYVGIRGDEEREGYISKKSNIQSIFPFRKNIWSEDVVIKALGNVNRDTLVDIYRSLERKLRSNRFEEILLMPTEHKFTQSHKLNTLLDLHVRDFNRLIFAFLQTTQYPLATESLFPLIDNDEVLMREDIFRILEESGVGIPAYYHKKDFAINGKKANIAVAVLVVTSASSNRKLNGFGYMNNIRSVLPKAMEYEKDGYTWNPEERLDEMILPERMQQIKEDFIKKTGKAATCSPFLLDILDEEEGVGCAACFI